MGLTDWAQDEHARDWEREKAKGRTAFILNYKTFQQAVSLAIRAGQVYGAKQRVFKDPVYGWTWERARS